MDYTSAPGYVTDAQGRRQYVDRDIPNGVGGTSLLAIDRNAVMNTLAAAIKAFGIVLNASDDTLLAQAIAASTAAEAQRASTIESNLTQLITALTQSLSAEETARITADANLAVGWTDAPVSTSVTVPDWATRVALDGASGAGGGMGCQGKSLQESISGAGGCGGGRVIGIYDVTPGQNLLISIGAGGAGGIGAASGSQGGATSVYLDSTLLFAIPGGPGGSKVTITNSAGGIGIYPDTPAAGALIASPGNCGSDGQSSAWVGFGNGGAGPWGGGGRAGSGGGMGGGGYGAGGGGAYDAALSGTAYNGGAGYQGTVLYRFLP